MQRIYAVWDRTGESFGPLFTAPNDGVARRNFLPGYMKIEAYDRDAWSLVCLGTYDDSGGIVVGFQEVEVVSVTIPRLEDVEQRKFAFAHDEQEKGKEAL